MIVTFIADIFAEVANGIYHAEPRTTETTTPTTLEEWTDQVMLPKIDKVGSDHQFKLEANSSGKKEMRL